MESVYQHFRKEEREFIDKVFGWKQIVTEQYRPKLTDFLDPREQKIIKTLIGENPDVRVQLFGGYKNAERKRAFFYPDYIQPALDDFGMSAFEIMFPKKFVTLSHREVLGSLMSLGLKRSKFGDIIIHDETVQVMVAQEIVNFLQVNWNKIGKISVRLKQIPFEDVFSHEEEMDISLITVSSLRLDAVLANVYHQSRQKIKSLIENSLVKVNWKIVEDAHFEIAEDDVLSVRGFGRSKVLSIEGKTRKDKWRIKIGIQK
jgi:RNA-binding protein YlmH